MVVDHAEIVDDVRCGGTHARVLVKGKRTKRQHPLSPFESRISTSCSSSAGGAGEGGDASTTSDESTMIRSTEEEEDMAHCLILLAQSGNGSGGGKLLPDVSTAVTRSGFYVHECKTCNRIFPSFQALGGHRASHKKQKPLPTTTVEPAVPALAAHDFEEEERQFRKTALLPPPLHMSGKTPTHGATSISSTNKQKVHECSICGSEFGSGQALGGHMRRHRTAPASRSSDATSASNSQVSDQKLSRNVLPLDLNLPAPEDDGIDSKFGFGSRQQPPILIPGPALVDCHYRIVEFIKSHSTI